MSEKLSIVEDGQDIEAQSPRGVMVEGEDLGLGFARARVLPRTFDEIIEELTARRERLGLDG